jgi:hypothetical protein
MSLKTALNSFLSRLSAPPQPPAALPDPVPEHFPAPDPAAVDALVLTFDTHGQPLRPEHRILAEVSLRLSLPVETLLKERAFEMTKAAGPLKDLPVGAPVGDPISDEPESFVALKRQLAAVEAWVFQSSVLSQGLQSPRINSGATEAYLISRSEFDPLINQGASDQNISVKDHQDQQRLWQELEQRQRFLAAEQTLAQEHDAYVHLQLQTAVIQEWVDAGTLPPDFMNSAEHAQGMKRYLDHLNTLRAAEA